MGHSAESSMPAALTSCPDCGREVSRLARHCVHCGRPWPVRHPLTKALWTAVIIALALASGSGVAAYEASKRPELPKLKNSGTGAYTDASIRPAGSGH